MIKHICFQFRFKNKVMSETYFFLIALLLTMHKILQQTNLQNKMEVKLKK